MQDHCIFDFQIFPAVVRNGEKTKITITPTGEHTLFYDDYEYIVEIWPAEHTTDHLDACAINKFSLRPINGKLIFFETFYGEQQFAIKIGLPEELQYYPNPYYHAPYGRNRTKHPTLRHPVLYIYSVNDDLYGKRIYKGDLHIHTYDSDGREAVGHVIGNLKKAGFDFAAITDHYWFDSSRKAQALLSELPDVFSCISGEEIHVPSEFIHVVSIGATQSVNQYYFEHQEECDLRMRELSRTLNVREGIDRYNYACRYWVAEMSKMFGGMPVLTHPFWIWETVYFMPPEITQFIFEEGNYEAFELLNGNCGRETNNLQTSFYFAERIKGFDMPIVGSSDCHITDRRDEKKPTEAYTLVLAKDRCWESIHEAILQKQNVAVEHYETDRNPRLYGTYRMVKYINFLLSNYFPRYIQLCYEQGALLKEYAYSKDTSLIALLQLHKHRADTFSDNFFGFGNPAEN